MDRFIFLQSPCRSRPKYNPGYKYQTAHHKLYEKHIGSFYCQKYYYCCCHVSLVQLPSAFSIFMYSRCDFPLSLREKKVLTYSSINTLRNKGGLSGFMRLVKGPTRASNLGLTKNAMEILSLTEFTVALCSTLR